MTRLFIVLTSDEASAILARQGFDIDARARGLDKIRTALDNATNEELAQDREVLRAKSYQPCATKPAMAYQPGAPQHFRVRDRTRPRLADPIRAKTYRDDPLRMAKATIRPKPQPSAVTDPTVPAPAVDNYVPWRDEAGGIYE